VATYLNLIGSKCRPQDEQKYLKWWHDIHIPLLLKFKGLKSVTRYKLQTDDKTAGFYMAVQEFGSKADLEAFAKSPELAAAREEMKKSWPDPASWEITSRATYEVLDKFSQ
jgi:hypothetical protein